MTSSFDKMWRAVLSLGKPTAECECCAFPGEGWVHGVVDVFEPHVQEPLPLRSLRQVACAGWRADRRCKGHVLGSTSRRQMLSFTAWSNDVLLRQSVESNALLALSRPTDGDLVSQGEGWSIDWSVRLVEDAADELGFGDEGWTSLLHPKKTQIHPKKRKKRKKKNEERKTKKTDPEGGEGRGGGGCFLSFFAQFCFSFRRTPLSPSPRAPLHPLALSSTQGRSQPFCSTSAVPRDYPSRVVLQHRLTVRSLLAATPAPQPLPLSLSSHGVRLAWPEAPHRPSLTLQLLMPPRLPFERRHTKRSMFRGIQCRAPARHTMWACCTDSSSDDDEHNTDNDALLLFGHAVVAPMLLSRLSPLAELSVALTCQFALYIFTIIQQDYPEGSDDPTLLDLELEDLA